MKVIVDGIGKKAKETAKKAVNKALTLAELFDDKYKNIGPVHVAVHLFDKENKKTKIEWFEFPTKLKAASFVVEAMFWDGATGITLYYPDSYPVPAEHYRVDYYDSKGKNRGLTLVIPQTQEKGGENHA